MGISRMPKDVRLVFHVVLSNKEFDGIAYGRVRSEWTLGVFSSLEKAQQHIKKTKAFQGFKTIWSSIGWDKTAPKYWQSSFNVDFGHYGFYRFLPKCWGVMQEIRIVPVRLNAGSHSHNYWCPSMDLLVNRMSVPKEVNGAYSTTCLLNKKQIHARWDRRFAYQDKQVSDQR